VNLLLLWFNLIFISSRRVIHNGIFLCSRSFSLVINIVDDDGSENWRTKRSMKQAIDGMGHSREACEFLCLAGKICDHFAAGRLSVGNCHQSIFTFWMNSR
jgi:hypothetical protein